MTNWKQNIRVNFLFYSTLSVKYSLKLGKGNYRVTIHKRCIKNINFIWCYPTSQWHTPIQCLVYYYVHVNYLSLSTLSNYNELFQSLFWIKLRLYVRVKGFNIYIATRSEPTFTSTLGTKKTVFSVSPCLPSELLAFLPRGGGAGDSWRLPFLLDCGELPVSNVGVFSLFCCLNQVWKYSWTLGALVYHSILGCYIFDKEMIQ